MLGKSAAIAALLSCAMYPAQAKAPGLPNYEAVKQVKCSGGTGTAFRIRGGDFVTAAHVTSIGGCTINGAPIEGSAEPPLDFAIIKTASLPGDGFNVNCEGFKPGQWYFAVGYGSGFPWQTMTRLIATTRTYNGMAVLQGHPSVVPGYSGGVFLNEAGEAVGVVNMWSGGLPFSISLPLSETSLCSDSARP